MTDKIGFVGGGQMGEALIKGMISAKLYEKSQIYVAEPDNARRAYLKTTYAVHTFNTAVDVWQNCSIVVLAVKPQVMESVLKNSQEHAKNSHLIITLAAGLPLTFYEKNLGKKTLKIVRVMPNTPALVLEGASALSYNSNVSQKEIDKADAIFGAVGQTVILDEHYLDAVTGLSGSGPAYVFTFIEALIDAGVKTGLTRDAAETLTVQTVLGSVRLMQEKKVHPAVLRAQVTSPGGTTIAGLHVLEKKGFRGIIMDAIEAATNRSKELGKQ